jgi:hypothetical protein
MPSPRNVTRDDATPEADVLEEEGWRPGGMQILLEPDFLGPVMMVLLKLRLLRSLRLQIETKSLHMRGHDFVFFGSPTQCWPL